MIDAKMKRAMKWHTEGHIDTDVVWEVAVKKALKNMDRDSLKRLLNEQYGLPAMHVEAMTTRLIWQELQRRNKEEKKYYSGSVAVTTWRSRRTFNELDDTMSNHRTDLITFKDGRYFGVLLDPKTNIMAKIPINLSAGDKKYTKEEITEAITTAWDKGEYAEDQTDISWIFNPDPEGFTGTVYLTTVYVRGGEGYESIDNHKFSSLETVARCVIQIKDGKYVKGVTGKPEIIALFKHHSSIFESEDAIRLFVKNKWDDKVFGLKSNYYNLTIIEEES